VAGLRGWKWLAEFWAILPGLKALHEAGIFSGIEPAEGGLERLGLQGGAASGGAAFAGYEVEENAGAQAGHAVGIVGDEGAPLVKLGVAVHGLVADPVAQDLAVIDDLIVVFGGHVIDTDGVGGEGDIGEFQVSGGFGGGDAEGLGDAENASGTAFVALEFDGEIGRRGGAMLAGAPSETAMTEGGGEGTVADAPTAREQTALQQPEAGMDAGLIRSEHQHDLLAIGRDGGGQVARQPRHRAPPLAQQKTERTRQQQGDEEEGEAALHENRQCAGKGVDFNLRPSNDEAPPLCLTPMKLCLIGLFAFACLLEPVSGQAEDGWVYLDNGQLRLGVNESAGSVIGWLSRSGGTKNLLNTFDVGRYVQQSFYGDKDGSDWNGKPWTYNPVQGGSWKNEPAERIESRTNQGEYYAKTRPRHWATGALLKEVTMEQWLKLEGAEAVLRFRMTYEGETTHRARHQELPALFVDASLATLVICAADQPSWKGAPLTRLQPGFPNEYAKVSEPWAAWVDKEDQGLGILFPGTSELTCYRVRHGHAQADCSYLAPIRTLALTPGLVVEYEVVLALGGLEEMRQRFAARMRE